MYFVPGKHEVYILIARCGSDSHVDRCSPLGMKYAPGWSIIIESCLYICRQCVYEKFRTNESIFELISRTTYLSKPRVLESVYREQDRGPPAGFLRFNRCVIPNVITQVIAVQYDVYDSQHPGFVRPDAYPPSCISSREPIYLCTYCVRIHTRYLEYKQ